MGEEEKAKVELATLLEEHKKLNEQSESIAADANFDQLAIQRLKRRKLWLRDRISYLYEFLCDDIIA